MARVIVGGHQVHELPGCSFFAGTVDQVPFSAAEFGNSASNTFAAQGHQQIRTITHSRVGGNSAEAITAAAFDANDQLIKSGGFSFLFISPGL